MPWLFSYGTLQDKAVQLAQFGRQLDGGPDALLGFTRGQVAVDDDEGRAAGLTHYENAVPSAQATDRIEGVALEVTDDELLRADDYEAPAGYTRHEVTLASGTRAWVYIAAGH
jgi:gamma-glutamylcyclotransferase (GGCT)/AIG2-like uncharacterized protein YtfP